MIIRGPQSERTLEMFQLSPSNNAVLNTTGRLKRQFPETRVKISHEFASDPVFNEALAEFLAKADAEYARGLKPMVGNDKKGVEDSDEGEPAENVNGSNANTETSEAKDEELELVEDASDVTMPKHLFDILLPVLLAHGDQYSGLHITKNTRNIFECIDESEFLRRSPLWLLLRITLHQELTTRNGDVRLYKRFMVLFHTEILKLASMSNTDHSTISMMCRKIAYRTIKLKTHAAGPWLQPVADAIEKASQLIKAQWTEAAETKGHEKHSPIFSQDITVNDFVMSCPELSQCFIKLSESQSATAVKVPDPKSNVAVWASFDVLPNLSHMAQENSSEDEQNLAMIEQWVEDYLDLYVESHMQFWSTCQSVKALAESYIKRATETYEGQPVRLSMALLTVLELWVACDKCALNSISLMADYSPMGVENINWSPLILTSRKATLRLSRAQMYLAERAYGKKTMLEKSTSEGSFVSRYVKSNANCQAMIVKIKKQSEDKKQETMSKLEELKRKCKWFIREHQEGVCTVACAKGTENVACQKCAFLRSSQKIIMGPCEEILPEDQYQADAIIFELNVPQHFAAWRDFSVFLAVDVAGYSGSKSKIPRPKFLRSHTILKNYFKSETDPRVVLAAPPSAITKKKMIKVTPQTEFDDVCTPTRFEWKLFDRAESKLLGRWEHSEELSRKCTMKLGDDDHLLQEFLYRRAHSPPDIQNHLVLMRDLQSGTSLLKHYEDLGALRLGNNIPWINLLRELRGSTVNWTTDETFLFIIQLAFEATPLHDGGPRRERHLQLENASLTENILESLDKQLGLFSETASGRKAIATFAAIAVKILSVTTQGTQIEQAKILLAKCRDTSHRWLKQEKDGGKDDAGSIQIKLDLALIHVFTFTVDYEDLEQVIDNPASIACYIFASIVIQENEVHITGEFQKFLHSQWKHLAVDMSRAILARMRGEPGAVASGFQYALASSIKLAESTFAHVSGPWIKCYTDCNFDTVQTIHFNLITSELLIDGKSPNTIPKKYHEDNIFGHLFGARNFAVAPRNDPIYEYKLREKVEGFWVCLGLNSPTTEVSADNCGNELRVLAKKNKDSFALVPKHMIRHAAAAIPDVYVSQYIHWYNSKKDCIQFHDRNSPWPNQGPKLCLRRHNAGWLLQDMDSTDLVVPATHGYFEWLSGIFENFTSEQELKATANFQRRKIDVRLDRLSLDFYVQFGESMVRSVQYRDMHVDSGYNLQTLIGLRSKLILSHFNTAEKRLLLVPDGSLDWYMDDRVHHVKVDIDVGGDASVQTYTIDERLGRLQGSGTFRSRIFLAYLHAVTSHSSPDPLTNNTGLEAALDILRSGAVLSCASLEEKDKELLLKIQNLCPKRQVSRKKGQTFVTVEWIRHLSVTSHHEAFWYAVQEVLFNDAQLKELEYDITGDSMTVNNFETLRKAAARRQSCFRLHDYGAEYQFLEKDKPYHFRIAPAARARDQDEGQSESSEDIMATGHFEMAYLAALGAKNCQRFNDAPDWADVVKHLTDGNKVAGATDHIDPTTLCYSAAFADPMTKFVQERWCSVHRALQSGLHPESNRINSFRLRFWLSTVAYAIDPEASETLISVLCAVMNPSVLKSVEIPRLSSVDMSLGFELIQEGILNALSTAKKEFDPTVKYSDTELKDDKVSDDDKKIRFDKLAEGRAKTLALALLNSNNEEPLTSDSCSHFLDLNTAIVAVKALRASISANNRMKKYTKKLAAGAGKLDFVSFQRPEFCLSNGDNNGQQSRRGYIAMRDITMLPAPQFSSQTKWRERYLSSMRGYLSTQKQPIEPNLVALVETFQRRATRPHEEEYAQKTRQSAAALQNRNDFKLSRNWDHCLATCVKDYGQEIEKRLQARIQAVQKTLEGVVSDQNFLRVVQNSDSMPRISLLFLLRQLSFPLSEELSREWKLLLGEIATLCRDSQHMRRLSEAKADNDNLLNELKTIDRNSFDSSFLPELELLEIDLDLCMRHNQLEVAERMMRPLEDQNAVMQLNMGEGKTSVIMPIICASIADGETLARAFMANAQSKQTRDTMIAALGGLMNRRVCYLPFSRESKLSPGKLENMLQRISKCKEDGSILLMQPEQHLSLKLSACLNEEPRETAKIIELLREFHQNSRDVIDEVDDNMSPAYELIYTIGRPAQVDLAPERWTLIQEMLQLVQVLSHPNQKAVSTQDLIFLRNKDNLDKYPTILPLSETAFSNVLKRAAYDFIQNGVAGFPMGRHSQGVKEAMFKYITDKFPAEKYLRIVRGLEAVTKSRIALLRGLIAEDLLRAVFMKNRWRVDYGCDYRRTPATRLAVPYAAKDVPKMRSEYSNPDFIILLTQLSYYNSGLRREDAIELVAELSTADDGRQIYESLFDGTSKMRQSLRALMGVNVRDELQFEQEFYPNIRYSVKAINQFLNRIVFPMELRSFCTHISASGWDLGENKLQPTTGFSGTSDLCAALPLAMTQQNLSSQLHTDALVLNNILNDSTKVISIFDRLKTTLSNGADVINDIVDDRGMRVILDVGAQIIQFRNDQIATHWLTRTKDSTIEAVIFFNEENELSVMDRSGRIALFRGSRFANKTDTCAVFLDEAHTRGTDLRLPRDYRAAVTIGAGISKDRLVQGKCHVSQVRCFNTDVRTACMRMRKLGRGQSITFYVGYDIEKEMREMLSLSNPEKLGPQHVLFWSMRQAVNDQFRVMPLWARQGRSYMQRDAAWKKVVNADSIKVPEHFRRSFVQRTTSSV